VVTRHHPEQDIQKALGAEIAMTVGIDAALRCLESRGLLKGFVQ
jgi:hypothetical protein